MKLRSKLFFSYFFLIILFSFSLIWLMFEIRELTLSLRRHANEDVKGIILVSQQLQKLEDLNSEYLISFLPGKAIHECIVRIERSRGAFHSNWIELNNRLMAEPRSAWYDKILKRIYGLFFVLPDEEKLKDYDLHIERIADEVNQRWENTNSIIRRTINYMKLNNMAKARDHRDMYFLPAMKNLREPLAELNEVLGKRGKIKANHMEGIARKTQRLILWTEAGIILLTIIAAYLGARKLTRPIPELKEAIDRIAIQDYDINIKNKSNDEIGELSMAFEQLSERMRESNTYKTGMLSQFTHEMKSPLGSIKQAVTLLENTIPVKDENQNRFFKIIKNNYETLFKLINNILHSTSYDAEDIKLKYNRFNIRKLIEDILVDMALLFNEKRIKVNINKSSEIIEGEFDRDKLSEVFQNIFSNAIKFSPENTTIQVNITTKIPVVNITVKDQGIGIPKKEIPYIFEKMYRASNSKSISVKGTGLGLYISSRIIRAHGGRIKVESEVGQGTTFKITIPRTRNIAKEGGWLDAD
ncbi:MAG: HAMP domain-containing histidine kinase [Calditrichaceae bacterium]|nr:HAMP domain-containing histidine kinase [Calditrichaceae bacterium]MBN2709029.1 HAMP domain-containing histidine kinase [Calditrichaceae bacterium]RQV96988.1 MAG: sensor histidine kinase [Calditrichota bacterium]